MPELDPFEAELEKRKVPGDIPERVSIPTPKESKESRLGLFPSEDRQSIREAVKGLPVVPRIGAEIAPSVGGTILGASAGTAIFPGVGTFIGAVAGGLLGEFLAQESGVTPESDLNLALSAAGPIAGKAFQVITRGVGSGLTKIPPLATALARTTARKATKELESLGGQIIAKQKGLMARPASDLYAAIRKAGIKVKVDQLSGTLLALKNIRKELLPLSPIPQAKQALTMVENSLEVLTGAKRGINITALNFDTIVNMRQLIGQAVKQAQRVKGLKLKSAKQVFKAMADDIDSIAGGTTRVRRSATLAQVAAKRAKLEFSIRDFERAVAQFSSDVPGEQAVVVNVTRLQKWLKDITTPASRRLDKNFTTALEDELPRIKELLSDLVKTTAKAGSPAGPGSIIVRGVGAKTGRAVVGGLIGFGAAGPIGAGIGGILGASIPEMLTAIFMTRGGSAALRAASSVGKGNISTLRWTAITQAITRIAGTREESNPNFSLGGA